MPRWRGIFYPIVVQGINVWSIVAVCFSSFSFSLRKVNMPSFNLSEPKEFRIPFCFLCVHPTYFVYHFSLCSSHLFCLSFFSVFIPPILSIIFLCVHPTYSVYHFSLCSSHLFCLSFFSVIIPPILSIIFLCVHPTYSVYHFSLRSSQLFYLLFFSAFIPPILSIIFLCLPQILLIVYFFV